MSDRQQRFSFQSFSGIYVNPNEGKFDSKKRYEESYSYKDNHDCFNDYVPFRLSIFLSNSVFGISICEPKFFLLDFKELYD